MKTFRLLLLLIVVVFYSCESDQIQTPQTNELRSLHPTDFENNWETTTQIKVTTETALVTLPWVDYAQTSIPWNIRKDIKKEDGWIFLSTLNRDRGSDYLIFYNKYSGLLKIFYYYPGGSQQNNAMWLFHDQFRSGYFNQGNYFTTPMDKVLQDKVAVKVLSENTTMGLDAGWNCVQMPITYTQNTNGLINVYSKLSNLSTIEFKGNYTSKTGGTIIEEQTTTTSNPLQNMSKSLVKGSGDGAEEWVKKEADKVIKNSSGITKTIFKNLGNLAGSLVSQGVSGLVSGGLNALFGSFLGTKEVSTPKVQTIELTTNGQLNVTGTITTDNTGIAAPLTAIPMNGLGAWNLKKNPVLSCRINRHTLCMNRTPNYGELSLKPALAAFYVLDYSASSVDVEINPAIKDEIVVSTRVNIVELVGSEWDKAFKEYYNLKSASNYSDFKVYGPNKNMKDLYPSLLQYDPNDGTLKVDQKSEIILLNSSAFTAWTVQARVIEYKENGEYRSNGPVSPYNYEYFNDYQNYVFINTGRTMYDLPANYKQQLQQHSINGTLGVYPGNMGVNVTVTMTVKKTGKQIISSRTYMPDYLFNF